MCDMFALQLDESTDIKKSNNDGFVCYLWEDQLFEDLLLSCALLYTTAEDFITSLMIFY